LGGKHARIERDADAVGERAKGRRAAHDGHRRRQRRRQPSAVRVRRRQAGMRCRFGRRRHRGTQPALAARWRIAAGWAVREDLRRGSGQRRGLRGVRLSLRARTRGNARASCSRSTNAISRSSRRPSCCRPKRRLSRPMPKPSRDAPGKHRKRPNAAPTKKPSCAQAKQQQPRGEQAKKLHEGPTTRAAAGSPLYAGTRSAQQSDSSEPRTAGSGRSRCMLAVAKRSA